jgi:hypothetical protein
MTFRNSVLKVGVDTTKYDTLVLLDEAGTKFFGGKYAIVCVITLDGMIIIRSKEFKMMLSGDGFFCSGRYMRGKMKESASVVYK